MSATGTPEDSVMAQYYLTRIYYALDSLLQAPPSLGLVQCLIGLAMLLSTTACSYNMSEGHFITTALRVIQGISYEDDKASCSTPRRDIQQEHRVFWLAFIIDTNASILTNAPTTHRHEDVVVCNPDLRVDTFGAVTAAEGHWKVDIFGLRVQLALLQAEATDQTLSNKVRNMTLTDDGVATAIVLARLQQFHDHEVFQLSASQLFQLLYRSDICHVVCLEASYFATVFRLHAFLAFERTSRKNPFSLEGLHKVAELRQQKSHEAAKRLLSLLPVAPRGAVGLYWMLHRTFIAALVTVFAHHINNPKEAPPTPVDMLGYNQVLIDLGTMVQSSGNAELAQLRDFCQVLFSRLEAGMHSHWADSIAEQGEGIAASLLLG